MQASDLADASLAPWPSDVLSGACRRCCFDWESSTAEICKGRRTTSGKLIVAARLLVCGSAYAQLSGATIRTVGSVTHQFTSSWSTDRTLAVVTEYMYEF